MKQSFGESLKRLRMRKGLSQQQLADLLHINRSTVARWENDMRQPDINMIGLISGYLDASADELFAKSEQMAETPEIIIVDDKRIILDGSIPVIKSVLPDASVTGFTSPAAALDHARQNNVDLAFLDIEMGSVSGFDLCEELLKINPRTNVIYLTAYIEYSFDAWKTDACGYILKPITADEIQISLKKLRYPLGGTQ